MSPLLVFLVLCDFDLRLVCPVTRRPCWFPKAGSTTARSVPTIDKVNYSSISAECKFDGPHPGPAVQRGNALVKALPPNWELVGINRGNSVGDAATALSRSSAILEVSRNFRFETQQIRPNDEGYRYQWNFDTISLPFAWEISPGASSDVTVAVVDTGLNSLSETFVFSSPIVGQIPVRFAAVPDLVSNGKIVNAYDFVYDDEFPVDLGGHGTHVAGTIAQQTNNNIGVAGVAYNVRLMPLKVISGGSGVVSWDDIFAPGNPGGSVAIVAQAIRFAADNNARVINLSLGSTGAAPVLRDAISYAVGKGAFAQ